MALDQAMAYELIGGSSGREHRSPLVDGAGGDGYIRLEMPGEGRDGSGREDRRDGLVEAGGAGEVDQLLGEHLGGADGVAVPLDELAELQGGVPFAAALEQPVEVPDHHLHSLFEGGVRAGVAVLGPMGELAEEEGVGEGPTADRDRRA